MARIKKTSIDGLREAVDIIDFIGNYVNLRRSGAHYKGLSPFTNEKTPSFFVHPEKKIFKCYSSGIGGDVIDFLQQKEHLPFPDAVEFLAEKYHFPLEYEEGGSFRGNEPSKMALFQIHRRAHQFFCDFFLSSHPEAIHGRNYWIRERHFSLKAAEEFGIGLSPNNDNMLTDEMTKLFSKKELVESGLFLAKDDNPEIIFPRFRGRLMIPISNVNSQIIGFSARLISNSSNQKVKAPKYINTQETSIFHKGQILFGLDRARQTVREDNPFLIVEGQLDCLRCWDQGFRTAIASQGTAITDSQIQILTRYCRKAYCVFDGDEAGRKAILRLIPLTIKESLDLRIVLLSTNEDPDTILLKDGADFFRKLLTKSQSAIEFLADYYINNEKEMSSLKKKTNFREIFKIISLIDSPIAEDDAIKELAKAANEQYNQVYNDYINLAKNRQAAAGTKEDIIYDYNWNNLLRAVLNYETIREKIITLIDPEWVPAESRSGRILNYIIGEIENGNELKSIIYDLPADDKAFVCGLMDDDATDGTEEEEFKIIFNINCYLADAHRKFILQKIQMLKKDWLEKSDSEKRELLEQVNAWQAQLATPPQLIKNQDQLFHRQ